VFVGAYPSGAFSYVLIRGHEEEIVYLLSWKNLSRDKHSSLFATQMGVTIFLPFWPVPKLFMAIIYEW